MFNSLKLATLTTLLALTFITPALAQKKCAWGNCVGDKVSLTDDGDNSTVVSNSSKTGRRLVILDIYKRSGITYFKVRSTHTLLNGMWVAIEKKDQEVFETTGPFDK
jgi:hypothetical protein